MEKYSDSYKGLDASKRPQKRFFSELITYRHSGTYKELTAVKAGGQALKGYGTAFHAGGRAVQANVL
jgi:hypothetical protein